MPSARRCRNDHHLACAVNPSGLPASTRVPRSTHGSSKHLPRTSDKDAISSVFAHGLYEATQTYTCGSNSHWLSGLVVSLERTDDDPSYRVSYEARRYLFYLVLHGYARFDWDWLIAVYRVDILDILKHLGRDVGVEQLVEEAVMLGYDRLTALAALGWTVGRIFLHTAITSVEEIDTEMLAEFTEAVLLFGELTRCVSVVWIKRALSRQESLLPVLLARLTGGVVSSRPGHNRTSQAMASGADAPRAETAYGSGDGSLSCSASPDRSAEYRCRIRARPASLCLVAGASTSRRRDVCGGDARAHHGVRRGTHHDDQHTFRASPRHADQTRGSFVPLRVLPGYRTLAMGGWTAATAVAEWRPAQSASAWSPGTFLSMSLRV